VVRSLHRYLLGDYAVQRFEGRSHDEVNWTRNAGFVCFGCFYGSIPAYLIYNKIYPYLQSAKGVGAFRLTLLDVTVHNPMLYFPLFYAVQSTVMTVSDASDIHSFTFSFAMALRCSFCLRRLALSSLSPCSPLCAFALVVCTLPTIVASPHSSSIHFVMVRVTP
jgi:hypothetical protein